MGDIVRRGSRWYVRYLDIDGKRCMRASQQPTRELARRYLLAVESRIARGVVGIPEPEPAAPTIDELVGRFLNEYSRPKIKDLANYRMLARCALRRALPVIGTMRADVLQAADVNRMRTTLLRSHAAATVRVTMSFLARVYSWAVRAKIVVSNPLVGVEKPPAPSSIEYLSSDGDRDEISRTNASGVLESCIGKHNEVIIRDSIPIVRCPKDSIWDLRGEEPDSTALASR